MVCSTLKTKIWNYTGYEWLLQVNGPLCAVIKHFKFDMAKLYSMAYMVGSRWYFRPAKSREQHPSRSEGLSPRELLGFDRLKYTQKHVLRTQDNQILSNQ